MTADHLADYLEESAARHPHRVAVVGPADCRVTYADMNRQADALAGFLASRGVQRGDRVGVVLPKSVSAITAFFGITKAGAAYVPVDAAAPPERSRQILADCGVRALFIDARMTPGILQPGGPLDDLAALVVVGTERDTTTARRPATDFRDALREGAHHVAPRARGPDDLAYIIYTSGSTGRPKGVMITHANALAFVEWCSSVLRPTADDRFSGYSPFHFDASVQDIYVAVKHGATMYVITEDVARDPRVLARFIAEHRLTMWTSTPSALMMLTQFGELEAHDTSALRVVSFGGEVFPPKHLRSLQQHWRTPLYFNMYGPTETTTACTFARVPSPVPEDRHTPYPIGFPCSHCRVAVLDDLGREVGPGEEGLLHISGPSVSPGYWNRPLENAAAFVIRDGVRWYNTGDVVSWVPEEGLTYVSRRDRMVKRRGYRIEMAEIERALYEHPRVSEAAVISIADDDGGVRIVAFVSPVESCALNIVELKAFCAASLPTYMSPDRIVFEPRLPRTATDKVDYQALAEQLRGARSDPRTVLT